MTSTHPPGSALDCGVASSPRTIGGIDLPALMAAEWLHGYCGRVARVNGFVRKLRNIAQRLHSEIKGESSEDSESTVALIPTLASAVKLDPLEVVLRHTMWPAIRATNRPTGPETVRMASVPEGRHIFSRPARREAWFCNECAQSDYGRLKFSYWRRNHQLPGSFRCRDHGTGLLAVDQQFVVSDMPHELAANQSLPTTKRAQALLSDKDALRASTIADAINDATLNLEVSDISALLVARAIALLRRRTEMDPAAEIKDFVRKRVKMNWVALAMPYGSTQNPQNLLFVDRLLYGKKETAVSGAVVGAVAAALFDRAEEAIKAFAPKSRSF